MPIVPMRPTSKAVWGLDIAASAIKGVRMRVEDDQVQVLEADILPLEGEPTTVEGMGRDRRIWQALQRFEAKYNLSADRVAVGLPGSVFFTRPFNLFLVGNRTEAELVRFEMEQHIPFGLDAVLWDYEIFETDEPDAREREGLLFAMKKEVLNNYLLSLSTARIEPSHIQAAPLALYNFVRYELAPEEPLLAVDIGAASTTLLSIAGSRYWLRTVAVGGEAMTAAVRAAFRPQEVSYEDAVAIKTALPRITRRGEVIERLMPQLRTFLGEIRNAVHHLAQEHKLTFDKLMLFGRGSLMYGLQRLLADELKVRVVTPAGLGRVAIPDPAKAAYVNANLPALATAIGLGLQGLGRAATRVNMVSATLAQRRTQTMARRTVATGIGISAALVISYGTLATLRRAVFADGAQKLAETVGPVATRDALARKALAPGEAEARIETLERIAQGRGVWLTVLQKVSRMLPDNEKASVPATDKVWLIKLALRPKPREAGIYEGEIEAGALLRADGTHRKHVETVLIPPLERDARGMYRNIRIEASYRAPTLSFSGGGGAEKYYLVRIKFDVVPDKGPGR